MCTYDNTSCFKCQLSTDLHIGRTYLIINYLIIYVWIVWIAGIAGIVGVVGIVAIVGIFFCFVFTEGGEAAGTRQDI